MNEKRATAKAPERQTLTITETPRILGVGIDAAYELVRRGELPTIRIGDRERVLKPGLEKLLGSKIP